MSKQQEHEMMVIVSHDFSQLPVSVQELALVRAYTGELLTLLMKSQED